MDGLEVASKLKSENIDLKVIIFSGIQDFNYAKTAVEVSADGYILKPLDVVELRNTVKKVIDKIELEIQNVRIATIEELNEYAALGFTPFEDIIEVEEGIAKWDDEECEYILMD
jgi:YesN/AraC family two-component response regulator